MATAKRVALTTDPEGVIIVHNRCCYRLRFDSKQLERISHFETNQGSLQTYGIIGKIDVGCGFLIAITGRSTVETINDKSIYQIIDVVIVPLELNEAISAISTAVATATDTTTTEESDEEMDDESVHEMSSGEASIVEDVLLRKPPSSIALRSWFPSPAASPGPDEINSKKRQRTPEKTLQLIPKLLKCIKALFSTKSFYFSHELDLTNSLARYQQRPRQVFIFNRHMSLPFVHTPLCLPIIQGFVGSVPLKLANEMDVDGDEDGSTLLLISRRSTRRPGVRYLRRGIDDQGYCANWVETEQLLVHKGDVQSFVQVRGSMPVYFAQSPYKLQPTPKLVRRKEDSVRAFQTHFKSLSRNYGQVLGISLTEMPPSKEAAVGSAYAEIAFENGLNLEWFDFHKVCKGMRFDRIAEIFDTQVGAKLDEFGWTDMHGKTQKGVFRINCVDCLDRTNVVETACARRIFEQQMNNLELELDDADFAMKFNGLWADNGDAISLQYSNTNALKGDFTRTQKRNYRGVLTDAFLSLSRYFYGMVTDFFTQAVLDYLLGNVGETVFDEFEEHLTSRDPAINFDSVRNSAIDIASSIAIADDEILYGGWWLLTPQRRYKNKVRRVELVDCILLVTDKAVYACNYDLKSDKVLDYERIPSTQVSDIQVGAFYGEILSSVSRDPQRNCGFVLKYNDNDTLKSSNYKTVKVNVSVPSTPAVTSSPESSGPSTPTLGTLNDSPSTMAFKIPPLQVDEYEEIVAAVMSTCKNATKISEDIVTLDQAKSDTGMWSALEYQIKKAVWG